MTIIVVIAALFVSTFQDIGQTVDQRTLSERIAHAPPDERMEAVAQAAKIAPAKRTRAMRRALAEELVRLNTLTQKRIRRPGVIESEWDTADIGEYTALLVKANAESGDPVSLGALIGAMGTGNMAIRAVARYGMVAFEPLMKELMDQESDVGVRSGAGAALGLLVDQGLDARQRRKLARAVTTILTRPERYVVASGVMELAAKSGDPALVALVESLASDPSAAQLTDGDPRLLGNLQADAKRALAARAK